MNWVVASYMPAGGRETNTQTDEISRMIQALVMEDCLYFGIFSVEHMYFSSSCLGSRKKKQSKLQRLANQRPKEFGQSQWIPKSITLHDLVTTKARSPSFIPLFSPQGARPVCGWFISLIYYGYLRL